MWIYEKKEVLGVESKNNNYFAGLFLPDSIYIKNRNGFQSDERCCGQGDGYYINIWKHF